MSNLLAKMAAVHRPRTTRRPSEQEDFKTPFLLRTVRDFDALLEEYPDSQWKGLRDKKEYPANIVWINDEGTEVFDGPAFACPEDLRKGTDNSKVSLHVYEPTCQPEIRSLEKTKKKLVRFAEGFSDFVDENLYHDETLVRTLELAELYSCAAENEKNPSKNGCIKCGIVGHDRAKGKIILCDAANCEMHLQCAGLAEEPTGVWFCPLCPHVAPQITSGKPNLNVIQAKAIAFGKPNPDATEESVATPIRLFEIMGLVLPNDDDVEEAVDDESAVPHQEPKRARIDLAASDLEQDMTYVSSTPNLLPSGRQAHDADNLTYVSSTPNLLPSGRQAHDADNLEPEVNKNNHAVFAILSAPRNVPETDVESGDEPDAAQDANNNHAFDRTTWAAPSTEMETLVDKVSVPARPKIAAYRSPVVFSGAQTRPEASTMTAFGMKTYGSPTPSSRTMVPRTPAVDFPSRQVTAPSPKLTTTVNHIAKRVNAPKIVVPRIVVEVIDLTDDDNY